MQAYLGNGGGLASLGPAIHGVPHEEPGLIYSTSELNDPEYSTDDFRMFSFKVARCSKRYVHDWRSCPFAHPTENARRRDPRTTRYLPVPCPDYKRGICMRGDACPYSHGVYECWLHPAKYRTQLCKEGPSCRRPVCFFAHSVGDLRQPTHLWNGGGGDATQVPSAAATLLMQQPSVSSIDVQRTESDAARIQSAAEEAFNNMEEHSVSVHSLQSASGFAPQPSTSPLGSQPESPVAGSGSGNATPTTPPHEGDPFANSSEPSSGFGPVVVQVTAPQDSAPIDDNNSNNGSSNGSTRVTLENNMQQRAANAAVHTPSSSWAQGLAASANAAAALAGVPVNEQPMLPNHGPRMSNAVARKLGLAPVKPATQVAVQEAPVPRARTAVAASSPHGRRSVDGALPIPQQQQQYQSRSSLDEMRLSQAAALAGFGGGMNYPQVAHYQQVGGYPASYPGADALSIHPALLNLVAANMANGNSVAALQQQLQHQQQQQHLFALAQEQQQQAAAAAAGLRNGRVDDGVASLLGHMSQWGLSESSGDSIRGDGSVHSSKTGMSYSSRGSESMLRNAAMQQVRKLLWVILILFDRFVHLRLSFLDILFPALVNLLLKLFLLFCRMQTLVRISWVWIWMQITGLECPLNAKH